MNADTVTTVEHDGEVDPLSTRRFALSMIYMFILGLLSLLVVGWIVFGDRLPRGEDSPAIVASGECDLPGSEQTGVEGIPNTGWMVVGAGEESILVPETPEHGPANTVEGVPSCWAQTPLGAVSAASAIAGLASTGNHHDLYQYLTAEGETRDRALAQVNEDGEPYVTGLEITGFRLVDYDDDAAEVEVVVGKDGVNVATVIDLVYEDGDWRYDPPTSLEPTVIQLDSLDGYTEFRKD